MLGIDVSKETLTAACVAATTRRCAWEMTVPNTAQGIRQLLRRTPVSEAWVVEPTGVYSRRVVQAGPAAGRAVLLAQPKRAKAFLAAIQPRAKTDRVDSRGLALYGLSAALRPFPVKSEAMERIEQVLAARKGISESIARLRQQRAVCKTPCQTRVPDSTLLATRKLRRECDPGAAMAHRYDRQGASPLMDMAVLVLNQNYEPLHICNARRALVLVLGGKAEVLQEESDVHLRTSSRAYTMPSVVRMVYLVRRPRPRVKLTRREVFLRDHYTCQYCGRSAHDLTIDHVMPKSRGGSHTWDNLVSACKECNHRKGGHTPDEARMRLRRAPFEPHAGAYYAIQRRLAERPRADWLPFIPGAESLAAAS